MASSGAIEAFEPAPTTIGLVEFARQAHEEAIEEHEQALEIFARAMSSCPCGTGVERRKCTCKNFEKVAAEGGSIFREALYTCHCDVGRTFSKCDNVYHIQALDLQSSSFEAVGKLDHAASNAEWMLELAPRLPDGYLRLGNIARLQKKDEYAWKVYTAGIEANEETALDSSPKLQQLYIARKLLNRRFFKLDPLCLPAELVTRIFMFVDFSSLPVCLRVCKKWASILRSPLYGTIWRDMIFPDESTKWAPRVDELKSILSWAGNGGARQIRIPAGMHFRQPQLTLLLEESSSLEHLEILCLSGLSLPSDAKIWTRLRHVSIKSSPSAFYNIPVDFPGAFPHTFLNNAASSLEHLRFKGIPHHWFHLLILNTPMFLKLKTLRISDDYDGNDVIPLPILPLAMTFPNLEQLWLGPYLPCLCPEPMMSWQHRQHFLWPYLKLLVFESNTDTISATYAETSRPTLRLMSGLKSLQYISLEVEEGDGTCIFSGSNDLIPDRTLEQYSKFQNLRSFETRTMCISPEGARTLLSKAIESEELTFFSIVFPEIDTDDEEPFTDNGDISILHLKGYEWFRGTSSIHTLGCHDFHFPNDTQNDEDLPLPQFLASFPNLRTLSIGSRFYEDEQFTDLVIAILRVTHLETIYIPFASLCERGQLRQVARAQGVQLVDGYPPLFGYGPQWPIPLKD